MARLHSTPFQIRIAAFLLPLLQPILRCVPDTPISPGPIYCFRARRCTIDNGHFHKLPKSLTSTQSSLSLGSIRPDSCLLLLKWSKILPEGSWDTSQTSEKGRDVKAPERIALCSEYLAQLRVNDHMRLIATLHREMRPLRKRHVST